MFLVALAAPLVAYAVYEWTQRKEIDEHKLINLFLGVGSYGILMVGLIDWGTAQSGYFGVTEGDYAFQHAEINLGWQALGLAVSIAFGLVTAWPLALVLERTIGLRADDETLVEGFDLHDWDIVHDAVPQYAGVTGSDAADPAGAVSPRGDGVEVAGNGPGTEATASGARRDV
jgi:ammonia channel protein AmtB